MKLFPLWKASEKLVLASGSAARRMLLQGCGIPFDIIKPDVNEHIIAADLIKNQVSPHDIALSLAHAKARDVAIRHPERLILAADQTLDFNNTLFMKPVDHFAAAHQLQLLRGQTHHLHSAAILRRGEHVLWAGVASATLSMRAFTDAFLGLYLDEMGDVVLDTVGGYQLEALGPHLFNVISGDHATILGLPLIEVLQALRDLDFIQA